MNAIEIKNLNKQYKDFRLDNLNLILPSGCIIGLIGENGAGKSTTIKLILDMVKKDSGNIKLFGKNNQEFLKTNKEDIGVVLDEIGISGCLTAKEIGNVMKYSLKTGKKKHTITIYQILIYQRIKCLKTFREE